MTGPRPYHLQGQNPPKMPPQARAEPAEPVSATNCTIMDLTNDACRWPLFEGSEPFHEKFFCGAMAIEGLPYCDFHCVRAYQPARNRNTGAGDEMAHQGAQPKPSPVLKA